MKRNNYQTKQREIILDTLENQKKPLTGPELIQLLKEQKNTVSAATIYRYLDLLIRQDKIRLSVDDSGQNYYEYRFEDCAKHSHLKCELCNQTIHFDNQALLQIERVIEKELGFQINNDKTVYVGICKECQRGNQDETN